MSPVDLSVHALGVSLMVLVLGVGPLLIFGGLLLHWFLSPEAAHERARRRSRAGRTNRWMEQRRRAGLR